MGQHAAILLGFHSALTQAVYPNRGQMTGTKSFETGSLSARLENRPEFCGGASPSRECVLP